MRVGFGLEQKCQGHRNLVGTHSGLIAAGHVKRVSERCQIVRVARSGIKYDGLVLKAFDLEASQCRSALQTLQINHNLSRVPMYVGCWLKVALANPFVPHTNDISFGQNCGGRFP